MNMQAILKQAQALQKDMMKAKDEIDQMIFEGKSSFVSVQMNGKKEIKKVIIDSTDVLAPDDFEMLEDMIMIATNDAMKKVDKVTEEKLGKFGNGMPGLF